jgi:hypothetical protein
MSLSRGYVIPQSFITSQPVLVKWTVITRDSCVGCKYHVNITGKCGIIGQSSGAVTLSKSPPGVMIKPQ